MSCPFCDDHNEPSWLTCLCLKARTAQLLGFTEAWQRHIDENPPAPFSQAFWDAQRIAKANLTTTPPAGSASLKGANQAAGKDQASLIAALSQTTPKASPHLSQKDSSTRDIGDCGPEASASLMDSMSAFSPRNQAILRFSEGVAATNPDLAGWVNRAAAAFLAGEPIPKRRPPKVAGKATKAARGMG